MNRRRLLLGGFLAIGLAASALRAGPSVGGDFSLEGGVATGGGQAAGGDFSVEASVGETATGPLTGGGFEVTGGLIGVAVVPGDFALTIGFTPDGQVLIGWPAEASGYVLESTPTVGEFTNWQPVTPAPAGNTFTTPHDQPLRFFRLHQP